jgi:hypothetical protein
MSFRDSLADYPRSMVWTPDELLGITPDKIARWFKLLVYGTATPSLTDIPTFFRSSNLEQAKKSILFFIPNKHISWDVRSSSGNPSKSVSVNDTVTIVRKLEFRKQGRPSCTKRDMKRAEYHKTMRILEAKRGNFEWQSNTPTMLKFQFHIIAQTDNITNLETIDLRSHNMFGKFALQNKVSWSMDVTKERACPYQLLSVAADTDLCILLVIACY